MYFLISIIYLLHSDHLWPLNMVFNSLLKKYLQLDSVLLVFIFRILQLAKTLVFDLPACYCSLYTTSSLFTLSHIVACVLLHSDYHFGHKIWFYFVHLKCLIQEQHVTVLHI